MEATVASRSDGFQLRHVCISTEPQTPPSCCAYSINGDVFPCLHGVEVLCEKYGAVNLHKFIHVRHVSSAWKRQYNGVNFTVPPQHKIGEILTAARSLVESKKNLQIPLALQPPRGRPSKDACVQRIGMRKDHLRSDRELIFSLCVAHLRTKLTSVIFVSCLKSRTKKLSSKMQFFFIIFFNLFFTTLIL